MACRACGATPTLGGARSRLGVPRRGAIEAMQGGGAAQEVGCVDGGEATGPIVAPSSSSSDNVGRTFPSCGGGVVSPHSSRPRARRVDFGQMAAPQSNRTLTKISQDSGQRLNSFR